MNIADPKQKDNENSFTGPGPEQMDNGYLWGEIKRQAIAQDPKAQGILEIKKSTKEELVLLNIEREKAKSEFENYRKSLKRTDRMLMGITMFFAVSFIITSWLLTLSSVKDKDLYLQNSNLYQNYSNQNFELKEKINNFRNEIENLKEQKILNLENENDEFSEIVECLKIKRYWQYEECFK